ncbi:hypothetical protein [Azospirillum picis]|uniref:Uncharacterized protein n=1 Tax=Azospirillum picis TaxID=488438 RepID=A0ABU0MTV1_9PROT|nr:hypothetical protein [Azospirillum picis]MBP2303167.1 hypothetical protein [Azospirillum picis]MDQ0536919.1 hypothetical protein [Azospirillum picis]
MTARLAVSLSALLLLGVASVPAMAELVPVAPSMPPAAYYGLPEPKDEVLLPGSPPPESGTPEKGPDGKTTGPAELIEGWDGGAAKRKDGSFAYCVVEGEFTSGHVLMIARSQKGETNIGVGIPGAGLPKDGEWPVTLEVDGKMKRERVAVAPQPDMLVVSNGKDEDLVTALMNGSELVVSSASDRIAFKLSGTKKVLGDLRTCVDKAGNVPPIRVAAGRPVDKSRPRLPEGLDSLLTAAGVHNAVPVPMDNLPPERRPADVAWRVGPIVGGIRERAVDEDSKIEELSDSFAGAMKEKCEGTATVTLNPPEQAGPAWIRTGSVECAMEQGKLHVAMTFLLSQRRLFTVIFHEAGEADVALADKVRDNLAQVLRRAGNAPPAAAAADPSAAASPPPAAPVVASPEPATPAVPSAPVPAPAAPPAPVPAPPTPPAASQPPAAKPVQSPPPAQPSAPSAGQTAAPATVKPGTKPQPGKS